ncbi:MAG: DASS family sodium-coupled anion symporter [Puniceicoccales bacterium]|jgi:sodium-dependent dicarboxylate transporter 2/3/5|nr:DASS family sodium-coupled anion symporter [Puniceicoccales bacterium]
MKRPTAITAGILLFLLPLFIPIEGLAPAAAITLGLFLCAGLFWVFEPIPIYATSLLVIGGQLLFMSKDSPLVLANAWPYPVAQAPSSASFMATLSNPVIILFLGGFMLAAGASKYSVEKGITRLVLAPFGSSPAQILLGFMFATALLSAFMSNTATTVMMIAAIGPIVATLKPDDRYRTALALSIPVASNIGGIATPIGTPPNAIAIGALAEQGHHISFSSWMLFAAPLTLVSLAIAWWALLKLFPTNEKKINLNLSGHFDRSPAAIPFYLIGGITILLWITEALHKIPSTLTAFIPIALFPAFGIVGKKEIREISWEVLWLVAGGIALGNSLQNTGLAAWMISLVSWNTLGVTAVLASFIVLGILFSNFLSNTVTAALFVPIAISLGTSGVLGSTASIVFVSIAISIAVSFGMSLPISTPPNAIASATGLVTTPQMARIGVIMAIAGFIVTFLFAFYLWPAIF